MPYSSPEGKLFLKDWIKAFKPKKVLDIGAGSGGYTVIISQAETTDPDGRLKNREYKPILHAVEIYEPYIRQFDLNSKYNKVYNGNILDDSLLSSLDNDYDLIIMGDVVEHISESDMISVWPKLKAKSKFIFISAPIAKIDGRPWYLGYNQGPHEYAENIYEKHICNWDFNELLSTLGPFLWVVPFTVVVVLIAEGDLK